MAVADNSGAGQWRRIIATVKPIRDETMVTTSSRAPAKAGAMEGKAPNHTGLRPSPEHGGGAGRKTSPPPTFSPRRAIGTDAIDKAWERDLRNGKLSIDMVIDLHDHHLAGAHSALASALDRATAQGARVLLVVAGKARGNDEAPRGAIRRELTTWLVHSPHARRILAVRNAHPRHGGAGAVYVVLRKQAPVL